MSEPHLGIILEVVVVLRVCLDAKGLLSLRSSSQHVIMSGARIVDRSLRFEAFEGVGPDRPQLWHVATCAAAIRDVRICLQNLF